jgi:hypothetical protein
MGLLTRHLAASLVIGERTYSGQVLIIMNSWRCGRDWNSVRNRFLILSSSIILAVSAQAANLVQNGGFEQLLQPGVAAQFGTDYPSQQLTDWSAQGYNFVFTPGSADTSGAVGVYGALYLWGPNNGSANGLPATSPDGGNYLAFDGAFAQGPISQTINGLTPGKSVSVSFWWGGAQQFGYDSATTEQFQVTLGSDVQFTPVLNNANHGFTGWQRETLKFVPTSASEALSFLAIGTPGGVPPFSLLDGVSVSDAPEPAAFALLGIGLAGLGGLVRVRRRQRSAR